jgi:hypothetical protein
MQPTRKPFLAKKRLPDEPVPIDGNTSSDLHPPVRIELKWNYESKAPAAAEYREYVDDEGLEAMLPEFVINVEVHHHLNAAQFRDLVRVSFNMSSVGAQIASGRLAITCEKSDTEPDQEEEDIDATPSETTFFNILRDDWSEIKQTLWGTRTVQRALLTFTTRPLGSSVLLEWAGPPTNLQRILQEKDGDIVAVTPPEKHDLDPGEKDGDAQENIVDEVIGSMGVP